MTEPVTELAPRPPIDRVAVTMGVAPTTLEEGWRLAQMIAKSGEMIPPSYRGSPEAILVAIQMGIEIGFAPMQALQSIAVIGGHPGLWGDGLLALVMSSPVYQDHEEYFEVEVPRTLPTGAVEHVMERRDILTPADLKVDTTAAVCTFIRRGKTRPVTRRFAVWQARKAAYLGDGPKSGKAGPWQTHPDRMLQMRARGFAARDCFPDVLRGIRTVEELRDIPPPEPEPLPRVVHRLSEQQMPVPAPVPPTPPTPAPAPTPDPQPVPQQLGPVGVSRVEHLIGGPCAFLSDGTQVWLENSEDAAEVAKFIGTSHRLVFSVVPVADFPQQRTALTFSIAE
jgi:hypothetical protein